MENVNAIGVIDGIATPAILVTSCTSWERSHASTRFGTTGGVRPLTLAGLRRRDLAGTALRGTKGMSAPAYTSFPSSGTSTSSPPV